MAISSLNHSAFQAPVPGQTAPSQAARADGTQNAAFGDGMNSLAPSGSKQTDELADFNEMAGVHHQRQHRHVPRSLQQRQQQRAREREPVAKKQNRPGVDLDESEVEIPLRSAADEVITTLLSNGESGLESKLKQENHDPLQEYALLHSALRQTDEQDLPQEQKEELKESINKKLSGLIKDHRDEIRTGLKDKAELEAAIAAMSGPNDPHARLASLHELRHLYGAKGNGKYDTPLTPAAMAKALQKEFGAENFGDAMSSLRGKMARELRVNPRPRVGPRLWLSLSDAACFNTVQTCFAIGSQLNRNLTESTGVLPKGPHSATAIVLLSIPESSKGKASVLVAQIVDLRSADPAATLKAYALTLESVRQMPSTMWPEEKLPQRAELIDDLSKMMISASMEMPSTPYALEEQERHWRAMLHAPIAVR